MHQVTSNRYACLRQHRPLLSASLLVKFATQSLERCGQKRVCSSPRNREGNVQRHSSSDSQAFSSGPSILFFCSRSLESMAWNIEGGKPPEQDFRRLRVWRSIQSASSVTPTSLTRCHPTINLVSGRKCLAPRARSTFIASSNGFRWAIGMYLSFRNKREAVLAFRNEGVSTSIHWRELVGKKMRFSCRQGCWNTWFRSRELCA